MYGQDPRAPYVEILIKQHDIAELEDGEPVRHCAAPGELALCKRLSAEVCAIMAGVEVGMGSESSDPFRAFFIAANVDEPVPQRIDADFIRSKFGGTLFPPVTITVEPLEETGVWWSEVLHDVSEYKGKQRERYLRPWLAGYDALVPRHA